MIDMTPFERWRAARDFTRHDVWQYGQQIAEVCLNGGADVILELGAHRGDSMRAWREAWNPRKLIGVELDERCREACEGLDVLWGDCNTEPMFRQVVAALGSDKYRVDYLFIDADHTYEGMRLSFTMYSSLVRPGGIIVLDDVCCKADSHGIHILAPEIQECYRTKIISGARCNRVPGEGILAVYP